MYNGGMKTALALLLVVSPAAIACDWTVTKEVDQMTDAQTCQIHSPSARISLFVRGDNITFGTGSAYRRGRDALSVRVDDNKAITFGRSYSTKSYFAPDSEPARQAISEIRSGSRLRTRFSDYPDNQEGDAAICNLPELIDSCL